MKQYVALLLGVNVGGNRKVPMVELKKVFEDLGFENIKTLLNTGNVVFDAESKEEEMLKEKIENELKSSFGFDLSIILIPMVELQKLVAKDPFKNITVAKNTRLYVTFLSEQVTTTLKIPYESEDRSFRILEVIDSAVISVLELSEQNKTTDAMNIFGKEFGKKITTRNWNTVKKIASLAK
jgi:uncharacterized protein (DUF1697 family)